jgi:hypothetical protein
MNCLSVGFLIVIADKKNIAASEFSELYDGYFSITIQELTSGYIWKNRRAFSYKLLLYAWLGTMRILEWERWQVWRLITVEGQNELGGCKLRTIGALVAQWICCH